MPMPMMNRPMGKQTQMAVTAVAVRKYQPRKVCNLIDFRSAEPAQPPPKPPSQNPGSMRNWPDTHLKSLPDPRTAQTFQAQMMTTKPVARPTMKPTPTPLSPSTSIASATYRIVTEACNTARRQPEQAVCQPKLRIGCRTPGKASELDARPLAYWGRMLHS
jgi:hypothetical protein